MKQVELTQVVSRPPADQFQEKDFLHTIEDLERLFCPYHLGFTETLRMVDMY